MSLKRKSPANPDPPLREGEWMCAACNAKNFSARVVCYKCPLTKQESEVRSKGKAALDWDCYKCKAKNFSFRNTCFKCYISRRESDDMKAEREGVPWLCRFCNLENFPHRKDCFKCKRPRETADVIPPRRMMSPPRRMSPPPMMGYPRDRSPPRMFPRGRSPMRGPSPPGMFRGRSRSPPGGRRLLPSPPHRPVSPLNKASMSPRGGMDPGEWRCQLCFTGNVAMRNDCYKCTTPRGNSGAGPGPASVHSRIGPVAHTSNGKKLKKGQWICTLCDVVNFAQRKECFKCKASKDSVAQGGDLSLSITIDNTPKENPQVVLNHSMRSDPDASPAKRMRPNEGPVGPGPGFNPRDQWGPDWICGICRVEVFPKRRDCFKCGRMREDCELRGDPRERFGNPDRFVPDPRDRPRFSPGPRDRFSPGPRDRFSPGPRDRYGSDPRDRFGPDQRDMPGGSGPPPGYTCRCGNFNRMIEPDCVRCGRPNDHRMDPRELLMRGGPGRSPPRFYSNTPRNRPPSPPRKVNKTGKLGKKKEEKYFPDWKCGKCVFTNFAKRTTCLKCSKKKEEVEEKGADVEKVPIPKNVPKFEDEWEGKTLPEVIEQFVSMWAECEADPERKIAEGEIDTRKMIKLKRIAKRLATKCKKKDPESEETKTAQKNYDCICLLHQKAFRDIKGTDEDWECGKCTAHNWAQRVKCFKCAADKPESPDEETEAVGAEDETKAEEGAESTSPEEKTEETSENPPEESTEREPTETVEEETKEEETAEEAVEEPEAEEVVTSDVREELATPEHCSDQDVAFQDY